MDSEAKAIKHYHHVETEYMPAAGFYNDSGNAQIRSQAVSIIATHSPNVAPDAFIAYLAMNYFDRYFSTIQFQDVQDVKSDSEKVRLIALCCLFISAKMRLGTFSRVKYENFTQLRIMEMEINILKVLQWRMLPVTPFVYLNYAYRSVRRLGDFNRRCINEIIVQAQGENEFVCYKPSIIAMSAYMVAAKILYPSGYNKHRYEEAEEKSEELFECMRALRDLCDRKNIKIEPPHDELIATLTDEFGNKTNLEEGSLEWEQKAISNEIVEIDEEEEQRLAKGKAVATSNEIEEIDEEEEQRLAKGKAVATSNEENRRLAKGKMVAVSELCNKTDLEEWSLEREQNEIPNEIVEIYEELLREAKGKAVATSNEENRRLAKGKMVAVSEICNNRDLEEGSLEWEQKAISNEIVEIDEEERSLEWEQKAISNEIVEIDEEEEERSLKWEQKAISNEIVEIDEEEEKRKRKGKAVAMFETYNEEKQRLAKEKAMAVYSEIFSEENRRLAKGKMVAVPEIFDGERQRQPPKSISEEEKKKIEKEEQEKIHRLEAAIKLAMEKGKLEKGVQVGRSLGRLLLN